MQPEQLLTTLVRIGIVSAIDAEKQQARVIYKDIGITSGWLYVLQGKHKHTVSASIGDGGGEHNHELTKNSWMPQIDDLVLVLYLPVFNGDGFILGCIGGA